MQKEAIKADDLVVHLLDFMHKVAHAQAEKAVDTFLNKIHKTLQKHVPVSTQELLIANALSTTFQFQMSFWRMIGNECIHPLWAKHSDWFGLAGIVQAIVETFSNNCAIMFPPAPAPVMPFCGTFRPASSEEDNDDDSFSHSAILLHSHLLPCSMEGISSSCPSGRRCLAVLLAHPHQGWRTLVADSR